MNNNLSTYSLLTLTALTISALYGISQYDSYDQQQQVQLEDINIYDKYIQWKEEFRKEGKLQSEFDSYKFKVFSENLKYIRQINQQNEQNGESLRLGLGPFADLSSDEFEQVVGLVSQNLLGQQQQDEYEDNQIIDKDDNLEQEDLEDDNLENEESHKLQARKYEPIDWTAKGAVTSVDDQDRCGGCWAFACKGALESLNFIKNGVLEKFSPQMLIDCSAQNNGCHGGLPMRAYKFTQVYGIELESEYPFVSGPTGDRYSCKYEKSAYRFKNNYHYKLGTTAFSSIYKYLNRQPLSIRINGHPKIFQHYSSGTILSKNCPYGNGHEILLTGFDYDQNKKGYFIAKNSWGTGWGMRGYVHLQAMSKGRGTCGCQNEVTWPQ